MEVVYLANDKYNAALTAGYTAGQNTLYVNNTPANVPTIVVAAKGTDNETVFKVTGSTVNSLTGVVRLRGANVDLDATTPITCLNNEEFINQFATKIDPFLMTQQSVAPAPPAAGFQYLYPKTDGLFYTMDSDGAETPIVLDATDMRREGMMNGNCEVWQRNITFSNPANNQYTMDRFQAVYAAASGTLPTTIVHSQEQLTAGDIPNSFKYYRLTPNGAGANGTGIFYKIRTHIENGVRIYGGASKKVTVTFWARSSLGSKKVAVQLTQNYGTGGSPHADEIGTHQVVTLTSSWAKYTLTFDLTDITGKTFGTDLQDHLIVDFFTMWNASILTGSSETFGGSGTIDFAQFHLNEGAAALSFSPKSFPQELFDCQRYYFKTFDYEIVPARALGQGKGERYYYGTSQGTGAMFLTIALAREMKPVTSPVVKFYTRTGAVDDVWDYERSAASGTAATTLIQAGPKAVTVGFATGANWTVAGVFGHCTVEREF